MSEGETRTGRGLASGLAVLTVALGVTLLGVGWWSQAQQGRDGLQAAVVAAAICWLGSSLALILTAISRGPQAAVWTLLFGMLFRMGLPLAAGLMLQRAGGPLAEAGVFGKVLIFYLVALAVETPLSLRVLRPPAGPSRSK